VNPQKTARLAGFLFVMTFVTSIPALALYDHVLNETHFVTGTGSDTQVLLGAFLEVLLIVANIGTALVLFPILKRQNEPLALGYVAARILESVFIALGVVSVLSIVTLHQDAGAHASTLVPVGRALVAMHDWTFLLGPGLMPALNALLIGSVMYRSRLLPRWIPTLGLIGAPLLLISFTATLFGAWDQVSAPSALLTFPIAVWEFAFGAYMTVKGFRPTAVSDATFAPVNSTIFADVADVAA
jgi:hypothetical protein